ncbi:MAG: hypothetical protein HQL70_07180 [Magnetococcales bacterium]|nr:hypothetical protein [Magnetococcales bacterium]
MTGLPVKRDTSTGSRVSSRISPSDIDTATVYQDTSFFNVTILDLGLEGFGILSDRIVSEGSEIYLDIPEEFGVQRYTCVVSFCRKKSDGFHVGLKIVECEEELILLSEE